MNLQSNIIKLKNNDWYERQKIAGACVAQVLKTIDQTISEHPPNLSLLDLEAIAIDIIEDFDCTATFKGYKGFPGSICLSVNKELVHGIPSGYILQDGDVVKFDLGATYRGAIADAAATTIYGAPKSDQHIELINTCKEALYAGIKAMAIGKQIGCIGFAISKLVSRTRFGLITNYGGHGIGENTPHDLPFIANKARPNEGIRIQPGLTIAIEPMLTTGSTTTCTANDGWTVSTPDIGSHFEHTLFVGEDKIHIMTEWESL